MKFLSFAILVLPGALAFPTQEADPMLSERQSAVTITDELLFSITLPEFISRRNMRDPPTVDWTSDGCSYTPDNPFGFPFTPACNRHDFGYNNYQAQTRFTESGRLKIDNNFKKDLYYQCTSVTVKGVCNALADVYYASVRTFGGVGVTPGKRDLITNYEEKVAMYEKLVEEAQQKGELPAFD